MHTKSYKDGWLHAFYSISALVGYLMPDTQTPMICK